MFKDFTGRIRRRISFALWECAYRINPMGFFKRQDGALPAWELDDALVNLARRPEYRAAIVALLALLEAKGRIAIDRRGSDDVGVWQVRILYQ